MGDVEVHGDHAEDSFQPLTAGDRAESFLPCCVPNLKFDPFVVQ